MVNARRLRKIAKLNDVNAKLGIESLEARQLMAADFFQLNHERVLDFTDEPTTVSVADGAWSDPATWSNGVPDALDRVVIDHAVNFDALAGAAEAIRVEGSLNMEGGTRLDVGTIIVFGDFSAVSGPTEIVFGGELLPEDVDEHGIGLIAGRDSSITTSGNHRTPFMNWIGGTEAGSTELVLADVPEGWQAGDRLFLPDTILDDGRTGGWSTEEYVEIAEVVMEGAFLESDLNQDGIVDKTDGYLLIDDICSGDAGIEALELWVEQLGQESQLVPTNRIRLVEPLQYSHPKSFGHDPHVANVTRDIVFRSANPDGVRGHVLLTDNTNVSIRDAAFLDLGRTENRPIDDTNQVGRYSLHLHRLGVSEWEVEDNVMAHGKKWGFAIHDTHFGRAANNVVVDFGGAGIVLEDGSETGNVISHNFVANIVGGSSFGFGRPDENLHAGFEGAGIWSRGSGSLLVDNVITNVKEGIDIWSRRTEGNTSVPTNPNDLSERITIDIRDRAFEMRDNTIYVANTAVMLRGAGKFSGESNLIVGLVAYQTTQIRIAYSGAVEIRDSDLDGRNNGVAIQATFSRPVSVFNTTIDGWKVIASKGRHNTGADVLFDTNGDGIIDENDISVDLNGDGIITREEFNSVF